MNTRMMEEKGLANEPVASLLRYNKVSWCIIVEEK